ncbi:cryptic protein isoform X2 [Numida meleagris]|uniref:cryptic protein isoform X2 n=1 Tax=Numida meleagris TaxID=8996 RepID=UPI000B3DAC80|nr:cryptic protein isoform X2 [Numida meleagris]
MYWRNHVRILFIVTLIWQTIHLAKGREKEHEKDVKNLNTTAQKQQPKNSVTIIDAFSDTNQSYQSRKQPNSREFVPFTGITDSKKLNRNCCQNGGTCILGAFCACPKHFSGRHCELRKCGSIAHGDWMMKGCWLCRCLYGTLKCLSQNTRDSCELRREEEIIRLYSNGLRLQQTMFAQICLLTFLLELCCWQL